MKRPQKRALIVQEAAGASLPARLGPDELVDAFFRGKDPQTVRSYEQRMSNFSAYIGAGSLQEAAAKFLSLPQAQANLLAIKFQDHLLRERKFTPNYVSGHMTALNSLVRLGRTLGLVPWTLEVDRVKPEIYRDTAGPGTVAIGKVLQELEVKTDPISIRDRTIITLLYQCCLRRNDLISLDLEHVDFQNHRLWPKRKKRSERTALDIHDHGEKVLREWIAVRGSHPGALFINFDPAKKGDGRISGMGIVRICHRYGLGRPHGLRHTGTTDALDANGGNIPETMKRTGHKDPKTLMLYNDNRLRTAAATSEKIDELMKRKLKENDAS